MVRRSWSDLSPRQTAALPRTGRGRFRASALASGPLPRPRPDARRDGSTPPQVPRARGCRSPPRAIQSVQVSRPRGRRRADCFRSAPSGRRRRSSGPIPAPQLDPETTVRTGRATVRERPDLYLRTRARSQPLPPGQPPRDAAWSGLLATAQLVLCSYVPTARPVRWRVLVSTAQLVRPHEHPVEHHSCPAVLLARVSLRVGHDANRALARARRALLRHPTCPRARHRLAFRDLRAGPGWRSDLRAALFPLARG